MAQQQQQLVDLLMCVPGRLYPGTAHLKRQKVLDLLPEGDLADYYKKLVRQLGQPVERPVLQQDGPGSFADESQSPADEESEPAVRQQLVVQLLEQAHSRLSEGYQWPAVSSTSSHQFKPPLRLKHLDKLAAQVPESGAAKHPQMTAALAKCFLNTLPASGTLELDQHRHTVLQWTSSATPALYVTADLHADVSSVPVLLMALLQQQLFVSVAYSTVTEQLEGHRPILPAEGPGVAGSTGDEAGEQLVEQSWGSLLKSGKKYARVGGDATYISQFVAAEGRFRDAEVLLQAGDGSAAAAAFEDGLKAMLEWLSYSWACKALDDFQAGWLSLGYWVDLAQLAQQLAAKQQEAGGSGDLAAAGHTRLREKQSLYFFRLLLKGIPLMFAHDVRESNLQQLAGRYTLTCPLPALHQLPKEKLAAVIAGNTWLPNRAKILPEIGLQLHMISKELQAAGATSAEKAAWVRRLQAIVPSAKAGLDDAARVASFEVFAEIAAACTVEPAKAPLLAVVLLRACWAVSAGAEELYALATAGVSCKSAYAYGLSQLCVSSTASSPDVAAVILGSAASSPDTLRRVETCQSALGQAAAEF
eukprot:gene12899-13025_t